MCRLTSVAAALCTLAALSAGCETSLDRHRNEIRALADQGRYEQIAHILDEPQTQKLYGKGDKLLWFLDRGGAALALHDDEGAIKYLGLAEDRMDERREKDAGETLAVLLINDKLGPYLGEPYEDIYVNVLKMLAQLEAGRLAGGATVEARRMANKVDVLREEYLRFVAAAEKKLPKDIQQESPSQYDDAGPNQAEDENANAKPAAPAPPRAIVEKGEFIDSTLGTFLTAVVYMHTGDPSNQAVAACRLIQAIEGQGDLIGPVNPEPFLPLETMTPGDANVLVVALAGQSPYKVPFRAPPLVIARTPIYFELPVLKVTPSEAVEVRVIVESPGRSPRIAPLHLVEDMASVAEHNYKRAMPAIYLRQILRAAAKSVALKIANDAVYRSTNNDAARFGAVIGGLLLLAYTEQADTRCWTLLPGRAFTGLLDLSPGETTITLEYIDAQGRIIYRTDPHTFDPSTESLTTIVERYWR